MRDKNEKVKGIGQGKHVNLLFYLMISVKKMPVAVKLDTQVTTWRQQEEHGKKKGS